MALFSKKKMSNELVKYFTNNKISYEIGEDTSISFMISFDSFSIFPYIFLNEDNNSINIIVNIKKIGNKEIGDALVRINDFNINSTYFQAKIKDNVILLEYSFISKDLDDVFDSLIDSLISQKEEILKL